MAVFVKYTTGVNVQKYNNLGIIPGLTCIGLNVTAWVLLIFSLNEIAATQFWLSVYCVTYQLRAYVSLKNLKDWKGVGAN